MASVPLQCNTTVHNPGCLQTQGGRAGCSAMQCQPWGIPAPQPAAHLMVSVIAPASHQTKATTSNSASNSRPAPQQSMVRHCIDISRKDPNTTATQSRTAPSTTSVPIQHRLSSAAAHCRLLGSTLPLPTCVKDSQKPKNIETKATAYAYLRARSRQLWQQGQQASQMPLDYTLIAVSRLGACTSQAGKARLLPVWARAQAQASRPQLTRTSRDTLVWRPGRLATASSRPGRTAQPGRWRESS